MIFCVSDDTCEQKLRSRHLDHLFAGRVRALAIVTRSGADVPARFSRDGAGLHALLAGFLAGAGVAHRDAPVPSARQRLVARHAARDLAHMARHRLPQLVLAVAPSLS